MRAAIFVRRVNQEVPLHEYAPGTWGPGDSQRLASVLGGWHDPVASS